MGRPRKDKFVAGQETESSSVTVVAENELPSVTIPDEVFNEDDGYNIEIVDDENAPTDVFQIPTPDPKYEYRGIYHKDENMSKRTNNMLHQGGGWQPCPREHLLKLGYRSNDIGPDGLLHRGDLVLARIPKELYQKKLEVKARKAAAPMSAVMRMIKKGDPGRAGINVHPTMRGLQTKEQLNANFGKDEE